MHDLAPGVHTFPLEGPRLTAAQVAAIAHAVRTLGADAWLVIDCSTLRDVAPAGLAALLELGQSLAATSGAARPLALAGLDRMLTRVAIETELARHFAIYADVQAFTRARTRAQQVPAIAEPERCAL